MTTYYIRHTDSLLISDGTRHALWFERRVAVHFPWTDPHDRPPTDTNSLDPEDYHNSGKTAIRLLNELAERGGYVCAEYSWRPEALIGYVEPGTGVELVEGRWSAESRYPGRIALLKTVRLSPAVVLPPARKYALLASRPRQRTISRWRKVGDHVERLVEGREPECSVRSLSTMQQEVLVSEYLRTPEAEADGLPRIASLVMPVGRTLPDVDVIGITADGRRVLAQVTMAGDPELKRRRLGRAASGDSWAVLFCPCDEPYDQDGVHVYPIGQAFERFVATEAGGRWWRAVVDPAGSN